jgi:hypothetical protein
MFIFHDDRLLRMASSQPTDKIQNDGLMHTASQVEVTTTSDEEFLEGSEGVTQHDLNTLRQVRDSLPLTSSLVVIVEFAEQERHLCCLLSSQA